MYHWVENLQCGSALDTSNCVGTMNALLLGMVSVRLLTKFGTWGLRYMRSVRKISPPGDERNILATTNLGAAELYYAHVHRLYQRINAVFSNNILPSLTLVEATFAPVSAPKNDDQWLAVLLTILDLLGTIGGSAYFNSGMFLAIDNDLSQHPTKLNK